jgi:hypothetical protein
MLVLEMGIAEHRKRQSVGAPSPTNYKGNYGVLYRVVTCNNTSDEPQRSNKPSMANSSFAVTTPFIVFEAQQHSDSPASALPVSLSLVTNFVH